MGMLALLAGCQEVNTVIDSLLGKRSPVLSAAQKSLPLSVVPVKKRPAGELPPPTPTPAAQQTEERKSSAEDKSGPLKGPDDKARKPEVMKPARAATTTTPPTQTKEVPAVLSSGKKRAPGPGTMAPRPKEEAMPTTLAEKPVTEFPVVRDPFKAPTEILPSECPPSMPLCRFDRSQLKVVGVIQVEDGQFKGMVEDPDGRGYFITPGMQIGGATVTQVTNKGIMLHVAKSKQDVMMPLFLEAREAGEF
jgi:hypothetical protein